LFAFELRGFSSTNFNTGILSTQTKLNQLLSAFSTWVIFTTFPTDVLAAGKELFAYSTAKCLFSHSAFDVHKNCSAFAGLKFRLSATSTCAFTWMADLWTRVPTGHHFIAYLATGVWVLS
jgi:hypothetical protein